MKKTGFLAPALAAIALAACGPQDASVSAGEDGLERPDQAPVIAASDDLMRLTCADFLATVAIARTQPTDGASLAAQDEIANGLTWLHGYLYGVRGGEIAALSQDWMAETAGSVFRACSKAEAPEAVSLFEAATL
ncbi:hypothetical protein Ga0102493_112860 [Erythrobacter litoralis]|jgi:hypothetical protein|uniref:Lipoprotein n=1 Tax=Erythrobacter litoralis TaxID=39960 RepID=A0A074MUH2_9SPHN|nr:hypothetical protein [Erythrobacter litoralis]AOL23865.1 hypothetical protein Ga0102493_112860 [Erythrobacter litoralis]KEO98651.1 hypothetical protein EH32_05985 [Erythrobacter litoralis]MEE4338139.1 hypothetical protein [Erythrobacter sp.]